ncbi:MAG TPA: response regulator [Bacteroidia bacterium]
MPRLKDKTVLIIEDDKVGREALADYLTGKKMNVLEAPNGKEALKYLKQERPHIILLDFLMPQMDGFEFLSKLKDLELIDEIPVLAVTALAMKGDPEKCLEAGAWDYLSKPVDLKILLAKMNKLLA